MPSTDPKNKEANLEVHFYNDIKIVDILNDTDPADSIFGISGGRRILGGRGSGQVKVTKIIIGSADNILNLVVAPIGDYSTYTLDINYEKMMDPLFSDIEFKFRPSCFTNNCSPEWESGLDRQNEPSIDYLAKDFDSFKHAMIVAMMERVPGWQPTSEADLDQLIINMVCASADELSDYQDRVMNEAYFGTARKRLSLAKHARLMDYHIHQGTQASTWIAIKLKAGKDIEIQSGSDWSKHLVFSTGNIQDSSTAVFMTKDEKYMTDLLNELDIYTWENSITTLRAGATTADLKCADKDHAEKIQNLIREGIVTHLLIQEDLDPITGKEDGGDKNKRQLLQLLSGEKGAKAYSDPVMGAWFVKVRWEQKDMLRYDYCFISETTGSKVVVEGVSHFYGNLIKAYAGRPVITVFKEQDEKDLFTSGKNDDSGSSFCDEMNKWYNGVCGVETIERTNWGSVCSLSEGPLLYEKTAPGGEFPTKSTLSVEVKAADPAIEKICWSSHTNQWPQTNEVTSFIHSGDTDDHFVVETDEEGASLVRFGNGTNGKKLPENVQIHCSYQVGFGMEGNVGLDKLTMFDASLGDKIDKCWNPFDVTDGQDMEPVSEIIRRVPEAFRFRQQRAITLQDYVNMTEKIPGVSQASARYAWTGSWRTVQIAVDPVGTTELNDGLRKDISARLDAVKLIGEDFEIRAARYIPLEIHIRLCIHESYWIDDIRFIIEQEFSNGYTPDGKMAFFHPDRWTFGQGLMSSQIIGRLQAIQGVDYVISVEMKRWNEATPTGTVDLIEIQPSEIIRVENNPDHMEKGFIDFAIKGGRGQK
jgi:hypothetical protein